MNGINFEIASRFNGNRINFVLENLKEGKKEVFLEPYFLKIKKLLVSCMIILFQKLQITSLTEEFSNYL